MKECRWLQIDGFNVRELPAQMQQRYYDPEISRFLSVDPVTAYSDPIGAFHRYRYANNNPYRFTDPDGRRGVLIWTAPDQVSLVVTYRVDSSQAQLVTSTSNIEARFAKQFSGSVDINGVTVQVTATAVHDPNAETVLKVIPTTQGVTRSEREETNRIGGDVVTLNPTSGANVVSHEFGHVAGAGDQYVGGIGADGQPVTSPGPGNNEMQDYGGPANSQTLNEIINAPSNTNICPISVDAASGAC